MGRPITIYDNTVSVWGDVGFLSLAVLLLETSLTFHDGYHQRQSWNRNSAMQSAENLVILRLATMILLLPVD